MMELFDDRESRFDSRELLNNLSGSKDIRPFIRGPHIRRRSNDLEFAGNPFAGVGGRSGFCPAFVGAGSIIYKRLLAQPARALSRSRRRSDATYRLLRPVAQYRGLWHLNDFFGAHFPRRRGSRPLFQLCRTSLYTGCLKIFRSPKVR